MVRSISRCLSLGLFALLVPWISASVAHAQLDGPEPIMMQVSERSQRLEMVANTSRILSLGEKIPRAQVNNPEILELTPLSPTQVQVFAKKPGVTQVNLWNTNEEIRSVDVIVYGDARELTLLLHSQFPTASLKVVPLANSVVVSGYVDRPDQVSRVIRIAEDFYPKVINNINVGGVQQVLLHVKVMEVSRTKMRAMGFDWSLTHGADFLVSSVSGLLSGAGTPLGGDTVRFGIVDNNVDFLGVLEALRQNNVAKILAEPTLVTVSGRAAKFVAGGEFPILVPAGLGTVSIEYKTFGTVVDFVPIVLGNGRIRLEVRPTVSELDTSRGVTLNNTTVPGLNVRQVDTGVEMSAGQTLALAGLIQNRVEAENRGLPILSDLPYLGVPFRRVEERNNEVELLIMVTPELVEAMDAEQVPPLGPGMHTVSPPDCDLYWRGHVEVPNRNIPPGYHGHLGPGHHHLPPQPVPQPPVEELQPGAATPQASRTLRSPRQQTVGVQRPRPAASPVAPVRWTTSPGMGPGDNPYNRSQQTALQPSATANPESFAPMFMGPVGYDVHP
ncbi:MAG: histidine kinase [Planctomycetales bacterium]|nr:histidine kinase [Planctomycetales bacterium]NIM08668.1 histidine kinase [Planctomycetales bacterium]NIN08142.1 histidine kinase [Planctomycetales bacterium]NIN77269.1 histidine kinase [Planctomycetales bacterium]NIO34453.1 histidine kinase [Planctomycetales bacterium]